MQSKVSWEYLVARNSVSLRIRRSRRHYVTIWGHRKATRQRRRIQCDVHVFLHDSSDGEIDENSYTMRMRGSQAHQRRIFICISSLLMRYLSSRDYRDLGCEPAPLLRSAYIHFCWDLKEPNARDVSVEPGYSPMSQDLLRKNLSR